MYNSYRKQYVLKQSSGKVWNLFYDERLGLCYSTLTKRNTWTDPVSFQKDVLPSFYADIGINDAIHVVSQDRHGNIMYTCINGNELKTTPILNSRSPAGYDKHPFIVPYLSSLNFFFVLQHDDSWILAHQVISENKINTPRVIDYVVCNSRPYSVVSDSSGNIFAFYQSFDGRNYQMGYKKYTQPNKTWGEFTPISRSEGDSELPVAVADGKNIIHLCYQRRTSKQIELIYQQKVPDRSMWTVETHLFSSQNDFINSSLVVLDSNVIIFWVRDDVIYYCITKDAGNTWSKPIRYNFPVGRQIMCISYRTNHPPENEKLFIRDIPGCFINGIKLAFLNDIVGNPTHLSAEELKNMIVDSLKMLKGSIEELREQDEEIKEDIIKIRQAQDNMGKELAKLSIRMGIVESNLEQSKLQKNKSEINENESKQ